MVECEHDFGKRLNVRNVVLLALRYQGLEEEMLQVQNSASNQTEDALTPYTLTIPHICHLFISRSVEFILCMTFEEKFIVLPPSLIDVPTDP